MELLIEDLSKLIKDKANKEGVTHNRGSIDDILPFSSTKKLTVIRNRFTNVLGEFTRNINNLLDVSDLNDEEYEDDEDRVINAIASKIETNGHESNVDLKLFLKSYLYENDNEVKRIHPYMYNYLKLSRVRKQKNEEVNIAKFMADVLTDLDCESLRLIFNVEKDENILTSLILNNLVKLKPVEVKPKYKYPNLFPKVSQLFIEDFLFLSKHKDYFLTHYPLLVQYYYFLYVSQIAWKFSLFNNADFSKVDPFYFALDWESISKRRNAAGVGGYKTLKEQSKNLFVHVHVLSQLSHNTSNKFNKFMTYKQLTEISSENEDQFIQSIYRWIDEYHSRARLKREINKENSIECAFKELFYCLKEGMNTQAVERYGEGVEDAAVGKFLKSRGAIGYTFNLTQDFLLLLTAVSVKDQRLPLVKLFEEFQKRGVKLDRYSIEEVVLLLDKLNMIDKKSDSGDAKYVKPIL